MLDESLQVNLLWAGKGTLVPEAIPEVPGEIRALMREVDTANKLLE